MKNTIIFVLLTLFTLSAFSQKAIYVSPEGNDTNTGLKEKPLQTLTNALILSRKEKIKTIILRGGKYYDISVVLQPADSGLVIKNYLKENPILYGGIQLTKLYKEGKFICTDLPDNKSKWDFGMILVNESLRPRSRLPEHDYFIHLNKWDAKALLAVYGGWDKKPTQEQLTTLKYDAKDSKSWIKDIKSAELTVLHRWTESYLAMQSVDTIRHILRFSYPATEVPGAFGNNNFVVWNTLEGMTKPGQWYWNKENNRLYYWPLKNENIKNIAFIVPKNKNIFNFNKGTKNITLEGLTISAASNQLMNEGFSAVFIDAAISGVGVSDILLTKLSINKTGGNAVKLYGNNVVIRDSKIGETGGGGIYFNGNNIQINHCKIENTGQSFKGAVGIYGTGGKKNTIKNCTITNTPYSGICLGGHEDSCLIENCTIKHAMTFMQDGAAIYCGTQKNTEVKNNFIIGNNTPRFTVGIYFDEQSDKCNVENNIVINTYVPVHCNLAKNITYKNNIFYDTNSQHINYGGSSDIVLNHNLLIAPSIQYSGPSIHDTKVDTTTIDPKKRKFANPTGLSSFRNNLIIITENVLNKTSQNLPTLDKDLLICSDVKKANNFKSIDFKKLITDQSTREYIDLEKLNINDSLIYVIMKEINK